MKTFVDLLNRKYLDYQNRLGRPAKVKEFAADDLRIQHGRHSPADSLP